MRRAAAGAIVLFVLGASQAAATAVPAVPSPGGWHLVHRDPIGQIRPNLVSDPASRQVVLVGGDGWSLEPKPFGGPEVWDGHHWFETSGPGERGGAALAYDAARRQVVLFGGGCRLWNLGVAQASVVSGTALDQYECTPMGDTWTWNGRRWARVASGGPTPRAGAYMAFDAATREIVMWGGHTCQDAGIATTGVHSPAPSTVADTPICGTELSDTWTWDGKRWTRRATAGPSWRHGAAMVADPATGQVLLVGGSQGFKPFDETWVWQGRRWSRSLSELPARENSSAVFDPAIPTVAGTKAGVLLFGGDTTWPATRYLADLWLWNGKTWRQQLSGSGPGLGPGARTGSAMTYDWWTRRIVLFGGSNANGYLGDTWTWAGYRWTRAASSGPARRDSAALVYDWAAARPLLFGGQGMIPAASPFGDTWRWDGRSWAQVSGPESRWYQFTSLHNPIRLVYDPAARRILLFGGFDNEHFAPNSFTNVAVPYAGETWLWDGARWSGSTGLQPPARAGSAMVYDAASRQVLLFGGSDYAAEGYGQGTPPGSALGDTWAWRNGWSRLSAKGPAPSPRLDAQMVYDAARGRVVLFGGVAADGTPLSDTWTWNGAAWSQGPAAGPPGRWDATMAYDPAARKVILFGGYNGSTELGDTWTWDGGKWTAFTPSGSVLAPLPRRAAATTYDDATKQLLVFGGTFGSNYLTGKAQLLGDTWAWTGTGWTELAGAGPAPRYAAGLAYDPATRRAVLFGGRGDRTGLMGLGPRSPSGTEFGGDGPLADTWVWNGAWTQVGGPAPTAWDALSPLAYDEATGQLVLTGSMRETWTW